MLYQAIAGACFAAAAGLTWYLVRQMRAAPADATAPSSEPAARDRLSGSAEDWCKVLDGEALLLHCHAQPTLDEILRQTRLAPEVFHRDLRAALVAYAEFVQLVPASESHHHAHPGGLLAHTLEVLLAATTLRNGYLLPLHAATEAIDKQRDHWTFAVFLAALLHDIGKIMADLRLTVRDGAKAPIRRWSPLSGALTQSRAVEYRVGFAPNAERDYLAHKKLGLVLLQGIVPANALAFLGREPAVLDALTCCLGGEDKPSSAAAQGAKALAQIIKRADQQSVAHNLQHGPRVRFATANSVPLIERLMSATRALLAQGTVLPLNRDGAAGWVYEGALWFVAKRLADTVRTALQSEEGAEAGVPGADKNDRLFDTWQDYGMVELNPATGQAIWHVMVQGEGYQHRLAMLKFPLAKLYDDAARYPAAMSGTITPVAREASAGEANSAAPKAGGNAPGSAATPPPTRTVPAPKPVGQGAKKLAQSVEQGVQASSEAKPTVPAAPLTPPLAPARSTGGEAPHRAPPEPDDLIFEDVPPPTMAVATEIAPRCAPTDPAPAPIPPPKAAGGIRAPKAPARRPAPMQKASGNVPTPATEPAPAPSSPPVVTAPLPVPPGSEAHRVEDDGLLDEADAVGGRRKKASKPVRVPDASTAAPVAPFAVAPKAHAAQEPTALAIAFIEWVQMGLATGALKYNETGAPIHFIAAGMALVSPRIFRDYALEANENADAVQKQVIAAGWHVKGPANSNILHYAVLKRDGARAGKLSVVLIDHVERWVNPVPPANACLMPFELSQTVVGARTP